MINIKKVVLVVLLFATIGMAFGAMRIGEIPSNADTVGKTTIVNETAKIVGAMVLGSVPDAINLNDKDNVTFEAAVYTDKYCKSTIVSDDHKLWIVSDSEFTNSTDVQDVQMVVYKSTEGYAQFEIIGGFTRETTKFTILSTNGDAPLQCSLENSGPWYNAIVKVGSNWETRQIKF